MSILKTLKRGSLAVGRSLGGYRLIGSSRWRSQRLLILCYHGISIEHEHLWRPPLFMTPSDFGRRLRMIERGGYRVLPLGRGSQTLVRRDVAAEKRRHHLRRWQL